MGGNALSFKTDRLNLKSYLNIKNKISNILFLNNINNWSYIPFCKNKNLFGDLDILLFDENLNKDKIKQLFNTNEIIKNDNIYSFDYDNFQIDLIQTDKTHFEFTKQILSYNGANDLVGRLVKNYLPNLKLKPNGLYFRYEYQTYNKDFLISLDYFKILEFLGLSVDKWKIGFESFKDIYEWIYSSLYFSTDLFDFNNLTNEKRKRYLKLKITKNINEYYNKKDIIIFDNKLDFDSLVNNLQNYFNIELNNNINLFKNDIDKKMIIKSKLNGHKILEWFPNFDNKKLSKLFYEFKNNYTEDWIYQNEEEIIKEKIYECIKNGGY